ncbi:MAG: hypothetical protein ABH840_00615 [Nanoarchaeota archaeon]
MANEYVQVKDLLRAKGVTNIAEDVHKRVMEEKEKTGLGNKLPLYYTDCRSIPDFNAC